MFKVVVVIVLEVVLGLVTNVVSDYIPGISKRKTIVISLLFGLVVALVMINMVPDSNTSGQQPDSNTQIGSNNSDITVIQDIENLTIEELSEAGTSEFEKFEIVDILVGDSETINPDGYSKAANPVLDFRLLNNSKKTVTISRLKLCTLFYEESTHYYEYISFSATYNVELDRLTKTGECVEIPVSHSIQPGAADRFKVVMGSKTITSRGYKWKLKPTLVTSEGEVTGSDISINI